jgi:hypothetical protein
MPEQGYPAIFPARPASLEPEVWPDAKSGFRRADLLIASEPRLVSDDQLRDPRIPKAPTVPRVHVPGTRSNTAEEQRPPPAPTPSPVDAAEAQATRPRAAIVVPDPAVVARRERRQLSVVIACVLGFVAATLALVAGLV